MGSLLMQYEYQLAKAKQTMYEHKGILLNNKHEMYTKRIENVTKLFSKRETQITSKWSTTSSQLSNLLSGSRTNYTSMMSAVSSITSQLGVSSTFFGTVGSTATELGLKDDATEAQIQSAQISALSNYANQIQSYMSQVIEAMKEAELAELEATKEAELEPLAEKDSEIQAEIATNDTLTTMADERAEKAKARLQKVVPESVAHYGLS